MLNIPPQQNQQKKRINSDDIDLEQEASYKEIADAVNQSKVPKYQSDDNILEELEQFSDNQEQKPMNVTVKSEKIKAPEEELLEEAPEPQQENYFSHPQQNFQVSRHGNDEIQEIAESIIEEKWQELTTKLGDFNLWKDRMENELTAIKQEIIRTQSNFANLQRGVFGKVSEYNENISNLGSEMKALEQVFEKIMLPLTTNVKELGKITEKLKDKTK